MNIDNPLPSIRILETEGNFITYRFETLDQAMGVYKTLRAMFHATSPKGGWYLELLADGRVQITDDHLEMLL